MTAEQVQSGRISPWGGVHSYSIHVPSRHKTRTLLILARNHHSPHQKRITKSLATSKGHLRGQQKNIQPTKTIDEPLSISESLDFIPTPEATNPCTGALVDLIKNTNEFSRSFSDQTGQFQIQSSRGNNYIFIIYDYDSNVILSKTINNCQGLASLLY